MEYRLCYKITTDDKTLFVSCKSRHEAYQICKHIGTNLIQATLQKYSNGRWNCIEWIKSPQLK